jgi:hypothetical protein
LWIEVNADPAGVEPLVGVLEALEAVDATPVEDAEEVTGEPSLDDEGAEAAGTDWRNR